MKNAYLAQLPEDQHSLFELLTGPFTGNNMRRVAFDVLGAANRLPGVIGKGDRGLAGILRDNHPIHKDKERFLNRVSAAMELAEPGRGESFVNLSKSEQIMSSVERINQQPERARLAAAVALIYFDNTERKFFTARDVTAQLLRSSIKPPSNITSAMEVLVNVSGGGLKISQSELNKGKLFTINDIMPILRIIEPHCGRSATQSVAR